MEIQVKDISKIYGTNENQVVALNHASMIIYAKGILFQLWDRPAAEKVRCFILSAD